MSLHSSKSDGPLLDHITLRGLPCDSVIGIYPHERIHPQRIIADITLSLDLTPIATEGNLSEGLDYAALGAEVSLILRAGRFYLLESAALCLARYSLMRWQTVQDVTVTLEKTAALGGLGSPAVTLKRYRRNVLETIPKGPDDGRLSPVPGTKVEIFVCPTTRVEWVLMQPAATREPRERGGPSSEPHGLPDSGTLTIVTEHSIEERGLLRIWASR